MNGPEFRLLPIGELSIHEEVDEAKVLELVHEIRRSGIVEDPIWVAKGTHVILNGHHRFRALQALGAVLVPAWVFDYEGPHVTLDRWQPGPAIAKHEVIRRAKEGRPFPPKTTRHRLGIALPHRPTPLGSILPSTGAAAAPDAVTTAPPNGSPRR